jgi:hypothetical protein
MFSNISNVVLMACSQCPLRNLKSLIRKEIRAMHNQTKCYSHTNGNIKWQVMPAYQAKNMETLPVDFTHH